MKTGLTWIENPTSIGLRFVGWSNDLRGNSRNSNYGFYSQHEDCSECYRGAVYQFPARKGRAVYVVGYREGSTGKSFKDWVDTSTGKKNDPNGPACLELSRLIYGDRINYNAGTDNVDLCDAAIQADSIAEHEAEESREYDQAWQAGREYADLGEEVAHHRRDALALITEIKAVRLGVAHLEEEKSISIPAISATLREHVQSHISDIRDARKKRAELADSVWRDYHGAFNDGAGATVLS